jgi:hypothetical protein
VLVPSAHVPVFEPKAVVPRPRCPQSAISIVGLLTNVPAAVNAVSNEIIPLVGNPVYPALVKLRVVASLSLEFLAAGVISVAMSIPFLLKFDATVENVFA